MILPVKTSNGTYQITLAHGSLGRLRESLDLSARALIVTDDGVPPEYARSVQKQFQNSTLITFPQGEATKCADSYLRLLTLLTENEFTRSDCVVAVGGGVVGDLAGFAAASYMRGIRFYNLPTTLLADVDSSVGGKTAIDFCGYKNIVGAFYPPSAVVIDPDVLKTLSPRVFAEGYAEAVKMAVTMDAGLFERMEKEEPFAILDQVIERSVELKRSVVEADEKEQGRRRILNFGHTLAHAIESEDGLCGLLHGECVAIGMLPMCSREVRPRLEKLLLKCGLPVRTDFEPEKLIEAMRHDKKCSGDSITVVYVEKIGSCVLREMPFPEFAGSIREALNQ